MATYNPPLSLFQDQVESIRAQTYADWTCFISDDRSDPHIYERMLTIIGEDDRFQIFRRASRLGFYRNFERALQLVNPAEFPLIALSDQDDRWYPEKLSTLASRFHPGVNLVYSDLRTVDRCGKVLSPSYWGTRANNYEDFTLLFLANTVTGAASMFRSDLLPLILPFPRPIGAAFHDHWIALVALATGRIDYYNGPLQDYLQHSGNVIGHATRKPRGKRLASYFPTRRNLVRHLADAKSIYTYDVLRLREFARELDARLGERLQGEQARTVKMLSRTDGSFLSVLWMARRALASLQDDQVTMGAERRLLAGLVWSRLDSIPRRLRRLRAATAPLASNPMPHPADQIAYKVAPIDIRIGSRSRERVNLLIPSLDLDHFFGGYIGKLNLARALDERGYRVRIVCVDPYPLVPSDWRARLAGYEGLDTLSDRLEMVNARGDHVRTTFSSRDVVIATTFWTAHVAQHLQRNLGSRGFVYLIQEYDPFTFPNGTWSALAAESYTFNHAALFSTELLMEYFAAQHLGVFAPGREKPFDRCFSFQNAITPVTPPSREALHTRRERRLLFYARPEDHAARNLFELGILGLREAIADGVFDDEPWEFFGIGAGSEGSVDLGGGRILALLPRQPQNRYGQLLSAHDVGLSLMHTPHPSLVPLEMAAAGLPTVTSCYANKTHDRLEAISENLIGVNATVSGVVAGLTLAVARCRDDAARIEGAKVHWARSWKEALNSEVMDWTCETLDLLH
jgi:glycosyltransferase involved in cell wall biosynthesis